MDNVYIVRAPQNYRNATSPHVYIDLHREHDLHRENTERPAWSFPVPPLSSSSRPPGVRRSTAAWRACTASTTASCASLATDECSAGWCSTPPCSLFIDLPEREVDNMRSKLHSAQAGQTGWCTTAFMHALKRSCKNGHSCTRSKITTLTFF